MKKPYRKFKEETGRAFYQMANLCAAATIFKGIEGSDTRLMLYGFVIVIMLYLLAMALVHSSESED